MRGDFEVGLCPAVISLSVELFVLAMITPFFDLSVKNSMFSCQLQPAKSAPACLCFSFLW